VAENESNVFAEFFATLKQAILHETQFMHLSKTSELSFRWYYLSVS